MNRQDNSQKEQFSHLPSTWHKVSVNFVADVIDPHPSHRAPEEEPGGIPFAGIGDLNEIGEIQGKKARLVSPEIYVEHNKRYQITENTIGFGRVASIGKIIDFRAQIKKITISPTIALIEPKEKKVDKKFLVQALKSEDTQLQINLLLTGSTRSSLGISLLREIIIPYPPLPEQQKIATILTSVDTVIEKTRAQIDKLKHLKTGMMQQLLTQGIGHTEFKDTPIGRIPKTWVITQISEVCSDIIDCVNKTAPVVDQVTPYRMIRTTNVRDGSIIMDGMRYVNEETYETWSRRISLRDGDIIFTREAPVGECGILKNSKNLFLGQRTMVYRADESKINNLFLLATMQSEYFKSQIDDLSGGSTTPHLRVPDCSKILLKIPPIEEQEKIANILQSIDTNIMTANRKLASLGKSKKAMMQDLLTGKVRTK